MKLLLVFCVLIFNISANGQDYRDNIRRYWDGLLYKMFAPQTYNGYQNYEQYQQPQQQRNVGYQQYQQNLPQRSFGIQQYQQTPYQRTWEYQQTPQQKYAGYQQSQEQGINMGYQQYQQPKNVRYQSYQKSQEQESMEYQPNQQPKNMVYQQYNNNPYRSLQEPINPETFDYSGSTGYSGSFKNSYGQPIVRPYPNYRQQDLPKVGDIMSVLFSTKMDSKSQEKEDHEDEEMIDLPPVEDKRGILESVLGNLYDSLTQSGIIKNKETKVSKNEVPKVKKHITTTAKPETDDCEFDFLFPDVDFEAKLKRCEEQQEKLAKKNNETQTETVTNKTEEEEPIPDVEKHFINGEECVCVLYFQCENDNVITDGRTLIDVRFQADDYDDVKDHPEGICSSVLDVCCKLKNNINEVFSQPDTIPEVVEHRNQAPEVNELIELSDSSEFTKSKPCKCVPYYQCSVENTFIKHGEGILEYRFEVDEEIEKHNNPCDNILDVCCTE